MGNNSKPNDIITETLKKLKKEYREADSLRLFLKTELLRILNKKNNDYEVVKTIAEEVLKEIQEEI